MNRSPRQLAADIGKNLKSYCGESRGKSFVAMSPSEPLPELTSERVTALYQGLRAHVAKKVSEDAGYFMTSFDVSVEVTPDQKFIRMRAVVKVTEDLTKR